MSEIDLHPSNTMISKLYDQLKSILPLLVGLYLPTFIILAIFAVTSALTDVSMSKFTRDPAAIMEINPFFGIISNIGVLLWCASATICFFGAALLRGIDKKNFFFFLVSGLITIVLLLDDLFLFHEMILPEYFHIPEKVTYAGYVTIILVYLVRFGKTIFETEFLLFFFALGFLGLSIVVDFLPSSWLPWHHLFEDGFKLFGIASWLGYFAKTCSQEIGKRAQLSK